MNKSDFLLIGNGAFPSRDHILKLQSFASVTYCLDGAYDHCLKYGISVDNVFGDMDSLAVSPPEPLRHPLADQSASDLDKALQLCRDKDLHSGILCGFDGGRKDHELMNYLIAAAHSHDLALCHAEPGHFSQWLKPGPHQIPMNPGEMFSLLSFEKVENLSLSGAKYNLNSSCFSTVSQGLSNICLKSELTLNFSSGLLLLVRPDTLYAP